MIYNSKLLPYAKKLRKNMTKQERKLWYDFLRYHERKFYKQKIIGNYIADFYCPIARLIIEVDGGQHYEPEHMEYDNIRSEYFFSQNIEVIQFNNVEIMVEFTAVCTVINRVIATRTSPTARDARSHLSLKGEA